ncbi:MAG: type II secretion system protein [Gallionella sp.]|nr:type II secretion system protein [Gallionella sp.]
MSKVRMQDAGCRMQEGVSLVATPVRRRVNPGFAESRILNPESSSGFTLIEMIMVIVITGIIGSMVAMFLKAPIQQYLDVSRRAELTDIVDTALFRLASDISTAVPNSIRVAVCGGIPCVEFLPTRDVGRYRAVQDLSNPASAVGDILDFAAGDGSFDIIGQPVLFAASDAIVVGSTQSDGAPAYDTTATSGVLRAYTGAAGLQSTVNMTATKFPAFAALSTQSFDVVDGAQQAVTFACEGALGVDARGNGQARLMKHWGYGFNATQVAPLALAGSSAVLANNVSGCVMDYGVANQRLGLLGVRLTLTSGGESVSLYQEIHVNNTP